jgi:hypothetical protein
MNRQIGVVLLVLTNLVAFSQTDKEEIARLKQENVLLREEVKTALAQAELAQKMLLRLRYLAISTALADKSRDIVDNEIAGLLVLQAYRFNAVHGWYTNENYIFEALLGILYRYQYLPIASNEFRESDKFTSPFSASVKSKGLIELRDNRTGAIRYLNGHTLPINMIVLSGSGKYMASLDLGRKLLIWDLENLTKAPRVMNNERDIHTIEFSADDNELRITFSNSKAEVFLINHGLMVAQLEKFLTRNLTAEEWQIFIAPDLPYEKTIGN